MNLAWNLTEKERLTLYYDSAEELGRLAGFNFFSFSLRAGVSLGSSVWPLLFLSRGKPKNDNSLKRLRIELRSEMTMERQQGIEVSHFYCISIKILAIMSITVFPHTNPYNFKPL